MVLDLNFIRKNNLSLVFGIYRKLTSADTVISFDFKHCYSYIVTAFYFLNILIFLNHVSFEKNNLLLNK